MASKDTFSSDAQHPGLGYGEPIGMLLPTDSRDFAASHGDTDMDQYLEVLEREARELTAGGRHDVERALGVQGASEGPGRREEEATELNDDAEDQEGAERTGPGRHAGQREEDATDPEVEENQDENDSLSG